MAPIAKEGPIHDSWLWNVKRPVDQIDLAACQQTSEIWLRKKTPVLALLVKADQGQIFWPWAKNGDLH